MIDLKVVHHFSDGLYAKRMTIPKGYVMGTHKHTFNHMSILASGTAIVQTDGSEKTYKAPACIEIAAGVEHRVFALEDVVWFCIHATDETDESKIDETLILKEGE